MVMWNAMDFHPTRRIRPPGVKPTRRIYVGFKVSWFGMTDALSRFEGGPEEQGLPRILPDIALNHDGAG